MLQGDCFKLKTTEAIIVSNDETNAYAVTINIPANAQMTNNIYFRNVRLMITSVEKSGAINSRAVIYNISLKESTNLQYSGLPPYGQMMSGCCPLSYCWDGSSCVNSNLWMENPAFRPSWNNVLTSDLYNGHVNASDQSQATGYRCVIVNDTSREAQWVLSYIKYDWNYSQSGYCARPNDCFVSKDYPALNINYSKGCVHDGDVVYGNHYCHQGGWTTKSYIVATLLQNISSVLGYSYILQCYSDVTLNLNSLQVFDNPLSSCVMVMQKSPTDEQIITGVILDTADRITPNDFRIILNNFLINLNITYGLTSGINENVVVQSCTAANPTLIANSNFSTCIAANHLFVYYETNYKYFLISDRPIPGITAPTFWERIVTFFRDLFKNKKAGSGIQPYDVINYTTDYDNIYIMRNNTLNVTALEEAKYDERNQSMVNILYVKYVGSNSSTNPIDRDILFNKVNDTMRDAGQDFVVMMNYTNDSNSQELILRTQNRSGLWPYLTTILRNRR